MYVYISTKWGVCYCPYYWQNASLSSLAHIIAVLVCSFLKSCLWMVLYQLLSQRLHIQQILSLRFYEILQIDIVWIIFYLLHAYFF